MSILRRERRKKARKEAYKIKWKDCSIPAKLFFDEVIKGNYSVLGNAPVEQLEKAYWDIMDEYVKLDDNVRLMDWYKKQEKLSLIRLKITNINELLYSISYVAESNDERMLFVDLLNKMTKPKVNFKVENTDNEIEWLDEILRVKNQVIGELENEVDILTMNDKPSEETPKEYAFEERLDAVENIHGYKLPVNISLREFIFKEKSAHKKVKAYGKQ